MRVILAEGVSASSGPVEIRATMIDVGRVEPGDARVAAWSAVGVRGGWRPGVRRGAVAEAR